MSDTLGALADEELTDQFVLVEGPRGTGKTRAILTLIVQQAMNVPGSRWLLVRSRRTRLTETVLVTLEEQVFPSLDVAVPGNASRETRHRYVLPNGSELITLGLDDPQRTQSLETCGVYVAECVEVANLDDVLALAGAMRQDLPVRHRCICDCNPGAPGHWANRVAEPIPPHWRRVRCYGDYLRLVEHAYQPAKEGCWKRIVTRHQDNPAYWDLDAWDWTDLGRRYLETLKHLRGHLRTRWLDGEWVAAEGTVFPEFNERRHVITPFPIPQDWPIYLGYDPGYDHPTAILWFTVAPNGTLYITDEIYRPGLGVAEHARNIKARLGGRTPRRMFGDPQHLFSRTAQSPRSIADQLRDQGLRFVPWPRTGGNEETMIAAVRELLIQDRLKVFAPCQSTIDEFQSWSYRRDAQGATPAGDEKPEDRNNHAMDVVKGIVAARIAYKPELITATAVMDDDEDEDAL